jgi:hypothetical protein
MAMIFVPAAAIAQSVSLRPGMPCQSAGSRLPILAGFVGSQTLQPFHFDLQIGRF